MERLTERIAGITGLKACYEGCDHPDNGCDCVRIRGALIKLSRYEDTGLTPEQVKAQQWISVKDRLPEKLEPVNIVWVNRKPERYYAEIEDKPFVATGYYWNDKWWWYSATCEDYLAEYGRSDVDAVDEAIEITHWMPLPGTEGLKK